MKARIHRVAIAVRDLENSIILYEKLLGTTFHRTGEAVAKEAGVYVAASWEAGVELVTAAPGSDNPTAVQIREFLDGHGDSGVFAVGFSTNDLDAAHQAAGGAGIHKLLPTFEFTQQQLDEEFNGTFTKFQETVMDTYGKLGFQLAYNIIEEKSN
jgi:catechol 2,3-dioxygenase-like lactoylglutathione lyase family enzyme